MAKEIPRDANFVGNMTLDILSDVNIQHNINDLNLYSRTFIISPFDILDFLPSYFSSHQVKKSMDNTRLIKNIINNTIDGNISDVDWRQISSADSVRVFTEAIKRYRKKDYKSDEKILRAIINDIIKSTDFSAHGTLDKIEFNNYERKNTKAITLLKYIRNMETKEMVTVPIGYRDPKTPNRESETYRPVSLQELKLDEQS
jgi:hypothetical protein